MNRRHLADAEDIFPYLKVNYEIEYSSSYYNDSVKGIIDTIVAFEKCAHKERSETKNCYYCPGLIKISNRMGFHCYGVRDVYTSIVGIFGTKSNLLPEELFEL